MGNLGGVLLQHQFQKCFLQLPVDHRADIQCLAPKCQCSTFVNRDEPSTVAKRLRWKGGRRKQVKVPRWVARPTGNFEDAGARPADVIDVPPRYGSRVLGPGPPGMRGVKHLYKQTPGGPPRCVVGVGDPHIFSCVDAALRAIASLLAALLREYEDYFGPVGISTETADLRAAMLKAFDWKELLEVRQPRPDTCKLSTPFFGDLI